MITPSQIRERKLSTVEGGGYDRGEVNELLLEVIESYEAIYAENKELYRKMEILANRIEEYRADEDSIKTALITAQKLASKVVSEAKEKAEKAISDSAASAQKTVVDAKEKAEKIIGSARDYAAELTNEKEKAANEIVADAEKKANEAISSSKIVAQNVLDQAKSLSKEIIDKSKAEKVYYDEIVNRLRNESKGFRENLISLYESQLDKLNALNEAKTLEDEEEKNIASIESELNTLISNIDEMTEVQNAPSEEVIEKPAEEEAEATEDTYEAETEAEEVEDASDEEAVEEPAEEETEPVDEKEIDEIIEEIGSKEAEDFDDFEEISDEPEEEPVDVDDAINAFSSEKITPIEDTASSIPVIEDEPDFESESMPFESYFNVNKTDPHNTDETISLIPPDDDEDDEPSKFKGFFKKKK